jgi:hypothetical protein
MVDDWSRPVSDGPEDDDWLADARPDLGPLREAAERGELADAVAGLAGSSGFRLVACQRDGTGGLPRGRDHLLS